MGDKRAGGLGLSKSIKQHLRHPTFEWAISGIRHQAHVGSRWAAQAHEPTHRPFKSRMSQMLANGPLTSGLRGLEVGNPSPPARFRPFKIPMLANGLHTSGPRGLEVGSPSPRAHLSPIQKSDVANVG